MNTFWQKFMLNKTAVVSAVILLLICGVSLFAPIFAPYDPNQMFNDSQLSGASEKFLLGSDQFGRDSLSRIIYGARVSLLVGFASVAISAAIGTLFGLLAGYFGKRVDTVIMRCMDILFAFPEILLALAIIATLGPGTSKTIIAIAIVNIPVFTRTVRGAVLSVKNLEYVEASIAAGATTGRILLKEILPNVSAPLIVLVSMAISGAILTESALSFLGLGIQPPDPSWGVMISESRKYMELAPGMIIWPSVAMTVTVLAFNLLGDALRDLLDPRYRSDK